MQYSSFAKYCLVKIWKISKSAGLYGDQDVILNALGESGIGKAASALLEKEMPHGAESHEAFCNQNFVTNKVR